MENGLPPERTFDRPSSAGCGLPPEVRTRADAGTSMPICSAAEMSNIASIHPDYQNDYQNEERQSGQDPSAAVTRDSEKTYNLYDTLLGRKGSDRTTTQTSAQIHPSIADSLQNRGAQGHEDIQNLADHYKGRSRSAQGGQLPHPTAILFFVPVHPHERYHQFLSSDSHPWPSAGG